VAKITYGNFYNIQYNPDAPDHRERSSKVYISANGLKYLPDKFDLILPKVCIPPNFLCSTGIAFIG
jgi:hypothetical protein